MDEKKIPHVNRYQTKETLPAKRSNVLRNTGTNANKTGTILLNKNKWYQTYCYI